MNKVARKGDSVKAQIEVTEGLQRKLNVEIPHEVVKSTFDKVYQDIQKQVEIKGFRKGKAPLATIKNMYKNRVQADVAQDLIQMHYPTALKDQKIEPISYPEFEFEDPSETKGFSFTAIFDIRPEVKVKRWEGLEVEKEKFVLDQKKIGCLDLKKAYELGDNSAYEIIKKYCK